MWRDRGVHVIAWTPNKRAEKDYFRHVLRVPIMTDSLGRKGRLCCLVGVAIVLLVEQPTGVSAVHLAYPGNTTACDTCDLDVDFSGRNFICCLAQSKCCGPDSLDRKRRSL
ncbi:hypothetical protein MTO96_025345 [Rhipicephalus appendiculatus]